MKEEEDGDTAGFDDWDSFHFTHHHYHNHSPPPPSSSSSSSHSLSPTPRHHGRNHDLSIFPPINHEDLPLSPLPAPPPTLSAPPPPLPPPPPLLPSRNTKFLTWFDFALHCWNSKLLSILTHLRSPGFFSSLGPLAAAASFLAVFWYWVRRRCNRSGWDQRVIEQLKLLIKEKDEKIVQLLEQISEMNKSLLARYKVPVLKFS